MQCTLCKIVILVLFMVAAISALPKGHHGGGGHGGGSNSGGSYGGGSDHHGGGHGKKGGHSHYSHHPSFGIENKDEHGGDSHHNYHDDDQKKYGKAYDFSDGYKTSYGGGEGKGFKYSGKSGHDNSGGSSFNKAGEYFDDYEHHYGNHGYKEYGMDKGHSKKDGHRKGGKKGGGHKSGKHNKKGSYKEAGKHHKNQGSKDTHGHKEGYEHASHYDDADKYHKHHKNDGSDAKHAGHKHGNHEHGSKHSHHHGDSHGHSKKHQSYGEHDGEKGHKENYNQKKYHDHHDASEKHHDDSQGHHHDHHGKNHHDKGHIHHQGEESNHHDHGKSYGHHHQHSHGDKHHDHVDHHKHEGSKKIQVTLPVSSQNSEAAAKNAEHIRRDYNNYDGTDKTLHPYHKAKPQQNDGRNHDDYKQSTNNHVVHHHVKSSKPTSNTHDSYSNAGAHQPLKKYNSNSLDSLHDDKHTTKESQSGHFETSAGDNPHYDHKKIEPMTPELAHINSHQAHYEGKDESSHAYMAPLYDHLPKKSFEESPETIRRAGKHASGSLASHKSNDGNKAYKPVVHFSAEPKTENKRFTPVKTKQSSSHNSNYTPKHINYEKSETTPKITPITFQKTKKPYQAINPHVIYNKKTDRPSQPRKVYTHIERQNTKNHRFNTEKFPDTKKTKYLTDNPSYGKQDQRNPDKRENRFKPSRNDSHRQTKLPLTDTQNEKQKKQSSGQNKFNKTQNKSSIQIDEGRVHGDTDIYVPSFVKEKQGIPNSSSSKSGKYDHSNERLHSSSNPHDYDEDEDLNDDKYSKHDSSPEDIKSDQDTHGSQSRPKKHNFIPIKTIRTPNGYKTSHKSGFVHFHMGS